MERFNQQQHRDPELLVVARKRASFKYHLVSYIVVNSLLWLLWFFGNSDQQSYGFPWPLYPMLGWGIGLSFHFLGAYVFPKDSLVDREYEKLIQERRN